MKAFSEQLRECHNNGTAMIVSVPDNEKYIIPGDPYHLEGLEIKEIIVCIKYKRICSSIVCKDERSNSNERSI